MSDTQTCLKEWRQRTLLKPKTQVRRWRGCELCTTTLGPNGPVYDPKVPDALLCECCVNIRDGMTAQEIVAAIERRKKP